jgi:hypothetical protein
MDVFAGSAYSINTKLCGFPFVISKGIFFYNDSLHAEEILVETRFGDSYLYH